MLESLLWFCGPPTKVIALGGSFTFKFGLGFLSKYLINLLLVGRCGHNVGHGHNASHFRLSCVRLVCFLRKSTEFHDMRTQCQIIIINFLLLISHKSIACTKRVAPRYLSICY